MTPIVSLEQKIIGLILVERGHTLDAGSLNTFSRDPTLCDPISQLIQRIDSLMVNPPASAEESETLSQDVITTDGEDSTDTDSETPAEDVSPPTLWKLMPYYAFDKPEITEDTVLASAELKPGQIPTEQQRAHLPVKSPAPPQARMTLPNARAGDSFSSPIAVTLDNGQQATIIDVVFPRDIGLSYVRDQQLITGIPTESGDFTLTVIWSCASHDHGETKQLFVVNPAPRSLWKVIDPPADAPYSKSHLDCAGLIRGDVRIAAASRRGRSHEHAGSFRDDDFYINHSDETGWSIMLVADGAGSAINSREGSRIAARTAGDYLFSQLNGPRGATLKEHIMAWGPSEQQATINAMLHHFKQAATLAVNSIQNEAICAEQPVKSYSTTLLATVSLRMGAELFAAAFWLGDGAIAAYSPSGKVRILGNPDSGEYAGQTRFLDQSIIADTAFTGRISVGKWNDVSHLILMTDGVSDPRFETDNGLRSDIKWTHFVNEIAPVLADADQAPAGLGEWLNFFSPGNHDDRTIVVSW